MWFIFQCSIRELEVLVEEEVVDEAENHFGVQEPPGQWSMISDQDHKKLLLYTWTLCWSPWMGRIFCPKTKLLGCNMCRTKKPDTLLESYLHLYPLSSWNPMTSPQAGLIHCNMHRINQSHTLWWVIHSSVPWTLDSRSFDLWSLWYHPDSETVQ